VFRLSHLSRLPRVESQLARPSEAEDVTAVVNHFEGAEAVLGVCERLVHGNGSADVLFVERVGLGGVDVGIPARPFVAGMIRLRMDLRGNRLQTDHHAVSADEGPEIVCVVVAASLVSNFESEFGLIEVDARLKIIDNKAGSDAVEGGHGTMLARSWRVGSNEGLPRVEGTPAQTGTRQHKL
jgi:hypothetical protein